jgi:hypothetical protein
MPTVICKDMIIAAIIAIFRAGLNFLKEYAAVAKMRQVVITTITLW